MTTTEKKIDVFFSSSLRWLTANQLLSSFVWRQPTNRNVTSHCCPKKRTIVLLRLSIEKTNHMMFDRRVQTLFSFSFTRIWTDAKHFSWIECCLTELWEEPTKERKEKKKKKKEKKLANVLKQRCSFESEWEKRKAYSAAKKKVRRRDDVDKKKKRINDSNKHFSFVFRESFSCQVAAKFCLAQFVSLELNVKLDSSFNKRFCLRRLKDFSSWTKLKGN